MPHSATLYKFDPGFYFLNYAKMLISRRRDFETHNYEGEPEERKLWFDQKELANLLLTENIYLGKEFSLAADPLQGGGASEDSAQLRQKYRIQKEMHYDISREIKNTINCAMEYYRKSGGAEGHYKKVGIMLS